MRGMGFRSLPGGFPVALPRTPGQAAASGRAEAAGGGRQGAALRGRTGGRRGGEREPEVRAADQHLRRRRGRLGAEAEELGALGGQVRVQEPQEEPGDGHLLQAGGPAFTSAHHTLY